MSRFVQAYWLDQHGPHFAPPPRGLPTGNAQIIIDLGGHGLCVPELCVSGSALTVAGALFNGADTRPFLVRYADGGSPVHYMGIDFKPGGAYPFVGPPAGELCDAHLPQSVSRGRCASRSSLAGGPTKG